MHETFGYKIWIFTFLSMRFWDSLFGIIKFAAVIREVVSLDIGVGRILDLKDFVHQREYSRNFHEVIHLRRISSFEIGMSTSESSKSVQRSKTPNLKPQKEVNHFISRNISTWFPIPPTAQKLAPIYFLSIAFSNKLSFSFEQFGANWSFGLISVSLAPSVAPGHTSTGHDCFKAEWKVSAVILMSSEMLKWLHWSCGCCWKPPTFLIKSKIKKNKNKSSYCNYGQKCTICTRFCCNSFEIRTEIEIYFRSTEASHLVTNGSSSIF